MELILEVKQKEEERGTQVVYSKKTKDECCTDGR
jgi:hypothetical protein